MRSLIGITVLGVSILMAGCATGEPDPITLNKLTAWQLGLASSDEVTISSMSKTPATAIGGDNLQYFATTAHGKRYKCEAFMTASLLPALNEADNYSHVKCYQR
ncbi:hypothetical protein WM40_25315 [Robbsia andropogonis]|uniref:Lipoprotein n=1 Tax=Robbsia andropogonis TaxID=28092 RepID=A0A0F5JUU4_9BURK|nr:hypothetical protein [Robbsia andropogonis]KKB61072.1 hypothetical protein WM40_25315 [Robbsia andropogonis]